MHLTFVHPAIGRKPGTQYMRSWQMEPLPVAALAGLTPPDVAISFFDDRMEAIAYDIPTDLVAIPVETYTAKRAYQIASEFRKRRVPVVMGGFHATLAPDEVARYAEAVVVGEAEDLWPLVIEDARSGRLKPLYKSDTQPDLASIRYDRRLFRGKNYLPIRLVETGRGCKFPCDFCAIQSFFERTARHRPIDAIRSELQSLKAGAKVFFFVDDNFAADIKFASELADAIAPLKIRWITQMSINAAHDEAFLARLAAAGCVGVLIGFESLDETVLRSMRKSFNTMKGGYPAALANLRRHGIRVYGTFVFGYGETREDAFAEAAAFAIDNRFYIAAFNHLTPFPGTPLYRRLQLENRLLYDDWWLDARYKYNDLPFRPQGAEPDDIRRGCLSARATFYSWRSIALRMLDRVNRNDSLMMRNFIPINYLHRAELATRDRFPLGDPAWQGTLMQVA
ncbi:MAG: B12-binding domain-containing radical SAM protein [Hyphomicrobium sp.]|nr:B12-binding domain-containing radical SAM protein [Hyphomicrobium sp.]